MSLKNMSIKDRENNKFSDRPDGSIAVNTSSFGDAYLNAQLTLKFWECIGVDCSALNYIVTSSQEPILTNNGKFIIQG